MKRMSFALTEAQLLDGSKTVTRRLGWRHVQVGEHLLAVRKVMGLAFGEKHSVLCEIVVRDVRRERLSSITPEDVVLEGFPNMTTAEFIAMFRKHMTCPTSDAVVTRIEFAKASAER